MKSLRQIRRFLLITLFITGCGFLIRPATKTDRAASSSAFDGGTTVEPKSDENGIIVTTLDPNSESTLLVNASADSNISNTIVAFPPGSLSIAVDITLKEGVATSSDQLFTELAITDNGVESSSTPVIITSSEDIDAIEPFTLAIGAPAGISLTADGAPDNLVVFYRIKKAVEGTIVVGLMSSDEISVVDGLVQFKTRHFGWFQAAVLTRKIEEPVEAPSTISLERRFFVLTAGAGLPACGGPELGNAIFVEEESTFKVCKKSGWENWSFTGPAGANGAKGTKGAKGDNGAAGPQGAGAGGGLKVYSADSVLLGDLGFVDRGLVHIPVSDGVSPAILSLVHPAVVTADAYGFNCRTDLGCKCHYSAANCNAVCRLSELPIKGQLYPQNSGTVSFTVGQGNETGVTTTNIISYRTSSTGVCNNGNITAAAYYPVEGTFTPQNASDISSIKFPVEIRP